MYLSLHRLEIVSKEFWKKNPKTSFNLIKRGVFVLESIIHTFLDIQTSRPLETKLLFFKGLIHNFRALIQASIINKVGHAFRHILQYTSASTGNTFFELPLYVLKYKLRFGVL